MAHQSQRSATPSGHKATHVTETVYQHVIVSAIQAPQS